MEKREIRECPHTGKPVEMTQNNDGTWLCLHDDQELSAECIVILDSTTGKVFIEPIPQALLETDADGIIESMADRLAIRVGECDYMLANSDDIIDHRHA